MPTNGKSANVSRCNLVVLDQYGIELGDVIGWHSDNCTIAVAVMHDELRYSSMQSVCMQFMYMQSVCMQSECMQFVCMQSVRMQSVCMQFVYMQSLCVQSLSVCSLCICNRCVCNAVLGYARTLCAPTNLDPRILIQFTRNYN